MSTTDRSRYFSSWQVTPLQLLREAVCSGSSCLSLTLHRACFTGVTFSLVGFFSQGSEVSSVNHPFFLSYKSPPFFPAFSTQTVAPKSLIRRHSETCQNWTFLESTYCKNSGSEVQRFACWQPLHIVHGPWIHSKFWSYPMKSRCSYVFFLFSTAME